MLVYRPGFPRRHLTSSLPRSPEGQVASWFKSSEEDASPLTIDSSAPFWLQKNISWLKLLSVFHFSHLETGGWSANKLVPFFWTPGRRDLLKKWAHNLVFAKIFNLGPTFDISVNLFPTYSYLKKSFFFLITFRRLESTLAPFVGVPPYESKAFLTNSVILWQKKT